MDNLSAFGGWSGEGEGQETERDLPAGNAICFIRLFYKPDIQFVLEDLVTDYSVNSQIIMITREMEKWGEGGEQGSGKWQPISVLSHLAGGQRGAGPLKQGTDRKLLLNSGSHTMHPIFNPLDLLFSPASPSSLACAAWFLDFSMNIHKAEDVAQW